MCNAIVHGQKTVRASLHDLERECQEEESNKYEAVRTSRSQIKNINI